MLFNSAYLHLYSKSGLTSNQVISYHQILQVLIKPPLFFPLLQSYTGSETVQGPPVSVVGPIICPRSHSTKAISNAKIKTVKLTVVVVAGKAMKSSYLLKPLCDLKFWSFSLLKIKTGRLRCKGQRKPNYFFQADISSKE